LTATASFGPGWWESYPNFNDVDDYHRMTKSIDTPRLGTFKAYTEVCYVNETNPNYVITSKSWMKRIKVTIQHGRLPKPVVLYYYISYY